MKLVKAFIWPWFFVFTLLITALFVLPSCKTVVQLKGEEHYKRDGIQYGVTRGLFLGRWWDFYERGRSFADGKFWKEAEADLRQAVAIRTRDDRRARTYGAHFIQYFVNRELGVVLFRQAEELYDHGMELHKQGRTTESDRKLEESKRKIKQAIDYLERSVIRDELSDNDTLTDKATYYLRLCYRRFAKYYQDRHVPIIHLERVPDSVTNRERIELVGWVEDDNYVDSLRINSQKIRLKYVEDKFYFNSTVPLVVGTNEFELTAVDTAGNAGEKRVFTVVSDRDPPAISIVEATDESVLLSVINEVEVHLENESLENVHVLGEISENVFRFTPVNPAEAVYIEFIDIANNRNGIRIRPEELDVSKHKFKKNNNEERSRFPILLASTSIPERGLFSDLQTAPFSVERVDFGAINGAIKKDSFERNTGEMFDVPTSPLRFECVVDDGRTANEFLITNAFQPRESLQPQDPIGQHDKSVVHQKEKSVGSIPPSQIIVQELENLENVYQEYLIISGRIKGGFKDFKINGQIKIKNGTDVRFSFKEKLSLDEENEIVLEISECVSKGQQEDCKKTFKVTRHPTPEEIREFRAAAVVCPLAKDGGDRELTDSLLAEMRIAMMKNRRFQISAVSEETKRIADKEFQLKEEGWIDAATAARFGKRLKADYSVACTVRPTKDDVEIFGRLIDTKTQTTLANCDVYEYAEDAKDFKSAYIRFIEELGQSFPVVVNKINDLRGEKRRGGTIKNLTLFSKGSDIILQMGKDANIKEGMRFVAYYRDDPLTDSETGGILVQGKVNKVGELFAKRVRQNFTHLKPITRMADVEKAKYVVSK